MHLCFCSPFSPYWILGTWFTEGIAPGAVTVGMERAHGRERAATMRGTARLQGKENLLPHSVGISGRAAAWSHQRAPRLCPVAVPRSLKPEQQQALWHGCVISLHLALCLRGREKNLQGQSFSCFL